MKILFSSIILFISIVLNVYCLSHCGPSTPLVKTVQYNPSILNIRALKNGQCAEMLILMKFQVISVSAWIYILAELFSKILSSALVTPNNQPSWGHQEKWHNSPRK